MKRLCLSFALAVEVWPLLQYTRNTFHCEAKVGPIGPLLSAQIRLL